jgi:uncharacterized protein
MTSHRSGLPRLQQWTRCPRTSRVAAALTACLSLAACTQASGVGDKAAAASDTQMRARSADPRARDTDLGPLPHGSVIFDGPRGTWVIDVELARSEAERNRGLMWRRELKPDHGMLFLFESESVLSFWMHNTLIALDMLHLDENRVVVGVVANAPPQTDSPRVTGKPARYLLEVSAGEAAAHAIGPGAKARFVGVPE